MTISVANAPCSYGAFEVTVGVDQNVPDGVTLLDHVAKADYQDIFPDPAEPADRPAADQAANREWLRARGI